VTLRVLVFQHESDDGPGYLGEALLKRGAALRIVRLDKDETIPAPTDYDMLLVMGGVMNVYAEDKYPWLADETRAIHQAVESDKAVLGVCLGGQLLAKSLDARVRIGAATEIGLTPITLTEAGKTDPLFEGLPRIEAVEWHDDTFDIPAGAIALASSEGCANQAFRFGDRVYGLQFHPEVSPAMLSEWINGNDRWGSFQHAVEDKAAELKILADRLIDNLLRVHASLPSP